MCCRHRLRELAGAGIEAYHAGLSACDIAARNATSRSSLLAKYSGGVVPIPAVARERLASAAVSADAALWQLSRDAAGGRSNAVLGALLERGASTVPWTIAAMRADLEQGFPHTHGPVICLPDLARWVSWTGEGRSRESLVRTLAHERVHVLQRAFPETARAWIWLEMGERTVRSAVPLSSIPESIRHRVRSNPDLDGHVYDDRIALFPSVEAARLGGLRSARVTCLRLGDDACRGEGQRGGQEGQERQEHPYEAMAYRIAERILH